MMSEKPWAAPVSADMQRIFGQGDRPPAAHDEDNRARGFVIQAADARPVPARTMRALTIAIPLLVVAAAIFLVMQLAPATRPATAVAQARPAAAPAIAAPARPAPVAYHAAAPVVADEPEGGPENTPDEGAVAAVTPEPAAVSPAPAAARRTRVASSVAAARPARAPGDRCRPGSDRDMCIYRDVRAADRRLVAAYRDAADAGVPRAEMVAVRRIWTRALADSLDDPDGTIRTYDDLARRLRDAAARMDDRRA